MPARDTGRPPGELGPGPLEAVVPVPQTAGQECLVAHVVLHVRRRDDDRAGSGVGEHRALERGQPVGIQVLDHLHEDRRVVAAQPSVGVREGSLQEGQPGPLALGHPVQVQPPGGDLQRPGAHVDADDLDQRALLEQRLHQGAVAAAQVQHPRGGSRAQLGHDRAVALHDQRHRSLPLLVGARRRDGVVQAVRVQVVHLGQPGHRLPRERDPVRQVPAGDQVAVGVRGQPALARSQQLVDLVAADPVVLGVVEHGQADVEVVDRVGEALRAGEPELDVPGVAPVGERLVEGHRTRLDRPPQRGEEPLGHGGAAPAGQRGQPDLQRQRDPDQVRPFLARAAAGAGEDLAERDREQAGRGIGTVVDVLTEAEPLRRRSPRAADEGDRVDLEQQRHRAPLVARLGVEHVHPACGHVDRLGSSGVLVQEETELGGGPMGGRQGQEHGSVSGAGRTTSSGFPPCRGRRARILGVRGATPRARRR